MRTRAKLNNRASYRAGVAWIAFNDNAGEGDSIQEVAEYISTLLLADLFGADPYEVARDIVTRRNCAFADGEFDT